MFGWLRRKTNRSPLYEISTLLYGEDAKVRASDLEKAIAMASDELLGNCMPRSDISKVAANLRNGPTPYSTEDLALATALYFFRRPELRDRLAAKQLQARLCLLKWIPDGRVNPVLARVFEESLYEAFK